MATKVLMLSTEFYPHIVGGLGRVTSALAPELAKLGYEVHVVTAESPVAAEHETYCGVFVHRVINQTDPAHDFLLKTAAINQGLVQYALGLGIRFDVIHAHDWLVAGAAWTISKVLRVPLVSTIHATEFGRNSGLHNEINRYIDGKEWRLTYESRRIIVNSRYMVRELVDHFSIPADKIDIVPNGIEPDRLLCATDIEVLRQKHNMPQRNVILFVGRLVYEKGAQVLLQAVPAVLREHPDTLFVIAGDGPYKPFLEQLVREQNVAGNVRFFGKANDRDLSELLTLASVQVVPSLYEPFGIVALEAMAAGVPVVTSDRGGLVDIIKHLDNGLTTFAEEGNSVAWALLQLLNNAGLACKVKAAARADVLENYTWAAIAKQTAETFERVIAAPV